MKNTCILSPATLLIDISQFHFKHSGLNKPGGAGSFLYGRCQSGVAAPHRELLFSDIKLRRYNEQRNQISERIPGTLQVYHYSCQQKGGRYNYAGFSGHIPRVPQKDQGAERQNGLPARSSKVGQSNPDVILNFLMLPTAA